MERLGRMMQIGIASIHSAWRYLLNPAVTAVNVMHPFQTGNGNSVTECFPAQQVLDARIHSSSLDVTPAWNAITHAFINLQIATASTP